MKNSLLLAALLLSSAAQAETWVCSAPTSFGVSYLITYVRQGEVFTGTSTITTNAPQQESRTDPMGPLEILVETDVMLTLARIDPDGTAVAITMINKITKQLVGGAVAFTSEQSQVEGTCVMI